MVDKQPNKQLVDALAESSPYLTELEDQLATVLSNRLIRLIFAYETETSPTAVLGSDGKWTRAGKREILVSFESATHPRSHSKDVFPINKDHSDMVKFSPSDRAYDMVLTYFRQLTTVSPPNQNGSHDSSVLRGVGAVHGGIAKTSPTPDRPRPMLIDDI